MKESKENGGAGEREKRREMEGDWVKGRKEEGKDDNFHWMLKAN